MDIKEYNDLKSSGYTVVPVSKRLAVTDENPVSLFAKVRDRKNNFLLESVEGGITWAQYSIIGFDCTETIKVSGNNVIITKDAGCETIKSDNPLDVLAMKVKEEKNFSLENMPRFYGGYVGFFAYESAGYAEKRLAQLPPKPSKFKNHMPEILLMKANKIIVFDNFHNTVDLIINANPQSDALQTIEEEQQKIESLLLAPNKAKFRELKEPNNSFAFSSNFTLEEYAQAVNRIKQYILDGDVMQVVLAQDFSSPFQADSLDLYRALRILNPSPYMYYLDIDDCKIVGASPEILVRMEDSKMTVRPIAGTRKRGLTPEEDSDLERDLLSDEKERAEHLMLIDLARNDVGRVAEFGSVTVTEKMIVERFSHVMHITSNVEGNLRQELSFIDAMKAALPAGTLSGAPKIRAMEIINELEPSSRGIYGGAVGYISWNGDMDTAIAIRTAVIKDDTIHVGAGGGIVADSTVEGEWQEAIQKHKVFAAAMEMLR
ncbi:MAG: anthranilate synthase component I [Gammaproteobacteria bacterium]